MAAVPQALAETLWTEVLVVEGRLSRIDLVLVLQVVVAGQHAIGHDAVQQFVGSVGNKPFFFGIVEMLDDVAQMHNELDILLLHVVANPLSL